MKSAFSTCVLPIVITLSMINQASAEIIVLACNGTESCSAVLNGAVRDCPVSFGGREKKEVFREWRLDTISLKATQPGMAPADARTLVLSQNEFKISHDDDSGWNATTTISRMTGAYTYSGTIFGKAAYIHAVGSGTCTKTVKPLF